MWSRVDLPAPFGPSSPVIPEPRANVMSLTATTFPYQRETRSRTIGWDVSTSTNVDGPERGAGGVTGAGSVIS